jgi:hypothetical protein
LRPKTIFKSLISIFVACFASLNLVAQSPFTGVENLFSEPKSYTLFNTKTTLKIDGELDEKAWLDSRWSDFFIDIEGDLKPVPTFKTRVKMLWDEKYLYIAAQMQEPHIWANNKPEKDIIFRDNVFKIFIDPDNNMNDDFEIQINPQNNMLFLIMNKPYRDAGVPVSGWIPIGIQSAVKISGTINNADDSDNGWTAEIALPLSAFNFNPKDAKQNKNLRINFLRTNFDFIVNNGVYSKALDSTGKAFPPHYSCWTPQGIINMHYPERWGYTQFAENTPNNNEQAFILPYSEKQRKYLWLAYYRQKEYFKINKRYASSLNELKVPENDIQLNGKKNMLNLEATSKQFLISIKEEGSNTIITLDQDGLISNLILP